MLGFLCILSSTGEIYEKKFGVLTTELIEMRDLMLSKYKDKHYLCARQGHIPFS